MSSYRIDPGILLLKWANRTGVLDDDGLCRFQARYFGEDDGLEIDEALVAWGFVSRERLTGILTAERLEAGCRNGELTASHAAALEAFGDAG